MLNRSFLVRLYSEEIFAETVSGAVTA